MESAHGSLSERDRLAGVVRDVRLRWRLKRLLRGATITLVVGFVILAVAAWIMNAVRYAPMPVLITRAVALASVLAVTVRYLILPLRRNPGDEQVALYLEEHEPSLDGALMTAVDVGRRTPPAGVGPLSSALAARLVHSALDRIRTLDDGRRVDAAGLTRTGAIFAAVFAAAVMTLLVGPTALRYGMGVSLAPWRTASATALFSIRVTPGNATVAKGGDQLVTASLHGFQSERVELVVRGADSTASTRLLMLPDSTGAYAFRLFDVGAPLDYAVEASGVRSPMFHLDVANLAYVKQIDLQYRYPAYTQLPPQDVDGTGDIAALAGTMVRVRVTPTVPAQGGRLVVDGGDTLQLAPGADGTLTAVLRVQRPGFYKVELQSPDARLTTASLNYNIDVLPDRPPTVSFTKPGRDQRVLSVDEVYTEAKADDDYGVARLDLVYSVNGGAERTVLLSQATARALRDISAGYTFMLEDDSLQPGDVVSYYARATDNNTVSGPQSATSDIYFLNVRPYDQEYRQGQSGGGGGQSGQGQNQSNQLSQQQREIIAGTFNLSRDSATYAPKDLHENLATLRLAQQKLREQTTELARRLVERGIAASDSGFRKISEILGRAAPQMDTAEQRLASSGPHSALSSEQRALAELQRAEAVFHDIQVSQGGGGGGGGGGAASGANAQDLADIFELNKDRLRNQYESVQRGQDQAQQQQQQSDQQVDEVMEKLRQLAARQQQQDERAQAKADSMGRMGAGGASSGTDQRQLAQQAEQTARQLERLSREQQSQALADAARRLQTAADAMRRAAADRGQQGAASSQQALQQLEDARRLLDRERSQRAQRDLQGALNAQRALANQQQRVTKDIDRIGQTASGQQQQLRESIAAQQRAMADSVQALTSRLDRMALENQRDHPDASRQIADAADSLKKRGTADRLGYLSQNATRTAPQQYLSRQQQPVGRDLADLGRQLQRASDAAGRQSTQQQQAEALDRMRGLVQGLQSVSERLRQQREQNAQGQQGQQGQGGQNGSGGQRAQSGQRGGGGGGGGGGGTQGEGSPPRMGAAKGRALTPGELQQFSHELAQRTADADTLRTMLARQGVDVAELDRAIDHLRAVSRPSALADTSASTVLQSQVIEGLKAFEFALSRTLGNDDQRVLLGRSGDVPPAFRALVEEYYRSIAHQKRP